MNKNVVRDINFVVHKKSENFVSLTSGLNCIYIAYIMLSSLSIFIVEKSKDEQ